MDSVQIKLLLLVLLSLAFSLVAANLSSANPDSEQYLPRYVVFPGLDADVDEVSEWSTGFASPFNVYFGPKPYILGWVGEAPFAPGDEEEGWEGEEGEEEYPEEEDEGEEDPEYDYE